MSTWGLEQIRIEEDQGCQVLEHFRPRVRGDTP